MYKLLLSLLVCVLSLSAQTVKKSPVDLLKEGRLLEAQKILEQTDAPERYHLLLDALREPNAIEACFLYREISARFPGTDCDEFAQERLLQAASMGIDISALVLEAAPEVKEGEWPVESTTALEVERPLIASVKKDEQAAEPVEISKEEPATEISEKTVEQVAAERVEQRTVAEKVETKIEAAPAVTADKPVSTGVTLDYSAQAKSAPDTGVKAAALTEEKKLVRPEKQEETENVRPHTELLRPHDIEPTSTGIWYIQVGAFGNHDNAHKFASRLRADGYNVSLVPFEKLMQVRVGGYQTKEQGRAEGDKIKAKYDCPAVLVTNP